MSAASALSCRAGRGAGKSVRLPCLPLENLSHDPEEDYFADGMTESP